MSSSPPVYGREGGHLSGNRGGLHAVMHDIRALLAMAMRQPREKPGGHFESALPETGGIDAPVFSFLRIVVMNLLRRGGYRSIRRGLRAFSHDIKRILAMGDVQLPENSTGINFRQPGPLGEVPWGDSTAREKKETGMVDNNGDAATIAIIGGSKAKADRLMNLITEMCRAAGENSYPGTNGRLRPTMRKIRIITMLYNKDTFS